MDKRRKEQNGKAESNSSIERKVRKEKRRRNDGAITKKQRTFLIIYLKTVKGCFAKFEVDKEYIDWFKKELNDKENAFIDLEEVLIPKSDIKCIKFVHKIG